MDQHFIDEYESGAKKPRNAILGLSHDDLLWSPPADAGVGAWSIQQVMIHLMDSDLIGTDRMKRIIAEENPLLLGYDETKFANRLFYAEQSAEEAATIFELNRRNFTRVLKRLPDEAFARGGIHNEIGRVTLESQVQRYSAHLEHHLGFIRQKREKLGKPIQA